MKRIIIAMTLILAMALGCAAFAEGTGPTDQVTPGQAEQAGAAVPEEEAAPAVEAAEPEETNDGLREAMDAFRDARKSAREEKLQAELDGYVADGKLTQEQADLIMKAFTEKQDAGKDGCGCRQMPGRQDGKGCGDQRPDQMMPGDRSRQFPGFQGGQKGDRQMPGQQFPGPQGWRHR